MTLLQCKRSQIWNRRTKAGGPPSPCPRNEVLLRLNTVEYYTLLGKAKEASVCRTEFLRQLIAKAEVKARVKPEEMQLIRTVSGMAKNLNQIAPRLNAFGITELREDMEALCRIIHELLKRLKS